MMMILIVVFVLARVTFVCSAHTYVKSHQVHLLAMTTTEFASVVARLEGRHATAPRVNMLFS